MTKYLRKKRYPYKLYIPENIEIREVLSIETPSFNFHEDYIVYILHLITSIPARLKDYDYEKHKGFTPINKTILSRRIHNYREYIDFLLKQGIIEEGTQYAPGIQSKGLKFSTAYRKKIKGVYITKNTLIKSITEKHNHRDLEAERKLDFLKQWFNPRLTIDLESAVEFLEKEKDYIRKQLSEKRKTSKRKRFYTSIEDVVTMGYNIKFMVVDKIKEGRNYFPIVDNTSGRFHSPLTQLKKELRKYLRYEGKRLYGIDIVNSQPLLALVVLDYDLFTRNEINKIIAKYNPVHKELFDLNSQSHILNPITNLLIREIKNSHLKRDVQLYKESVINGSFYELFGTLLLEKNLLPDEIKVSPEKIRKFAKNAIFNAFFSEVKHAHWNKHIKAFKTCFPTVAKIFDLIKAGRGNHPALACTLQRFESNLVLHQTCTVLNETNPEMPLFTVHDSIVSTKSYAIRIIKPVFEEMLFNSLGARPQLKVEKW